MGIEVRVPDEIEDYKEKIIAGLSVRQLVCLGTGIVCAVPTFLLLRNISLDLATYVSMAVCVPAFLMGFVKPGGYNFETYFKIRVLYMLSKTKRGYETDMTENIMPAEVERFRRDIQKYHREEAIRKIAEASSGKFIFLNVKKRGVKSVCKKTEKSKSRKNKIRKTAESDFIEITKKSCQRKRKAAAKAIKAAARSHRAKKQKNKKTA